MQEQSGALMAKCNETANLRPRYSMTMMNMNYYDGSDEDSEKYLQWCFTTMQG